MSFARRGLIAALLVQLVGSLLQVVELGLDAYLQALSRAEPGLVGVTIGAIACGLLAIPVWSGRRWAPAASLPLLAAMLIATLAAFGETFTAPTLTNFANWLTVAAMLVAAAAGLAFGLLASVESRAGSAAAAGDGDGRPAALLAAGAVGALAGMTLLAVAVAASPSDSLPPTGEPGTDALAVTMRELRFEPSVLHLTGGKPTAVEITNDDPYEHSFDVDELDVHVLVGAGQIATVWLTPATGDNLRLYCAIAGHAELGMVGQVVGD